MLVINTLQYGARYTQRHINTLQYGARYTQRHINTLQYGAHYSQRQIKDRRSNLLSSVVFRFPLKFSIPSKTSLQFKHV